MLFNEPLGIGMANTFHLAVPAGDLAETKKFYCEVLGCEEGNQEAGRWVDINFWGNELTLHQSDEQLVGVRHDVDMGNVSVPHFGAHLSEADFQALKAGSRRVTLTILMRPIAVSWAINFALSSKKRFL